MEQVTSLPVAACPETVESQEHPGLCSRKYRLRTSGACSDEVPAIGRVSSSCARSLQAGAHPSQPLRMCRPGVCAPFRSAQHHFDVLAQQRLFGGVGAGAWQGGLGRRCCRCHASHAVTPRVRAPHGSRDSTRSRLAQRIRAEGYDGGVWRQARRNTRCSQEGDLPLNRRAGKGAGRGEERGAGAGYDVSTGPGYHHTLVLEAPSEDLSSPPPHTLSRARGASAPLPPPRSHVLEAPSEDATGAFTKDAHRGGTSDGGAEHRDPHDVGREGGPQHERVDDVGEEDEGRDQDDIDGLY